MFYPFFSNSVIGSEGEAIATALATREQEKLCAATLSRKCLRRLDAIRNGRLASDRRQAYSRPAIEVRNAVTTIFSSSIKQIFSVALQM